MDDLRDIDRKAAVAVAEDFAGAEPVAPGGVVDRKAFGVGETEGPVARRRGVRTDAIDAAPIERAPGAVDPGDELETLAERERNLAAARQRGARVGIGVDRTRLGGDAPGSDRHAAERRVDEDRAARRDSERQADRADRDCFEDHRHVGSPASAPLRSMTRRGGRIGASPGEVKRESSAPSRRRARSRCRRRRPRRSAGWARWRRASRPRARSRRSRG